MTVVYLVCLCVAKPVYTCRSRYHCLVTKYGKLEPLAEIDLRPRCHAKVEVHCEDKVEEVSIRLDQTVAELKKQLRTVVQLSANQMRLYYIDKECVFGPEEMKYHTEPSTPTVSRTGTNSWWCLRLAGGLPPLPNHYQTLTPKP